jgi:hypothetical protein
MLNGWRPLICIDIIGAIGDICSTAGNAIESYGERIAAVVGQFSVMRFDPAKRDSIQAASEVSVLDWNHLTHMGRNEYGTTG